MTSAGRRTGRAFTNVLGKEQSYKMEQKKDGMNYAPKGKPSPVVAPGEFCIAAIALDHGHIYGMCNGLTEAGAKVKWVYDPDAEKVRRFLEAFPEAKAASGEEEILSDPEVKLVCGAAVTSERCALGLRAMAAGKDYFTDKAPLTSLEQLEAAREMVKKTGSGGLGIHDLPHFARALRLRWLWQS